jgi:fibronectin-binding autotransporter adhesin
MTRLDWLRRTLLESGACLVKFPKSLTGRETRRRKSARSSVIERLEDRTLLTAFVVNTTSDSPDDAAGVSDGLISLREAIVAANTNAAFGDAPAGMATGDTISFDPTVFGGSEAARTIALNNGTFIIIDDLRITGVADGVILNAGGSDRAFRIASSQLTILQDLTITNATAPDLAGGGAIRLTGGGRTILSRVVIDGASANGRGAGILNINSTLETFDVQIRNSTATNGGGLANINGINTLNRTLISGNTAAGEGGGLSNDGGRLILRDSVVSFNTANAAPGVRGGGGIHNTNNGRLAVSNTQVFGNQAANANGGGIFSTGGVVTIGGSIISQNSAARSGGGITIINGELIMTGTQLGGPGAGAGNIAGIHGGGLQNAGAATVLIEDSWVQFNEAGQSGGGLWNSAQGKLTVRGGAPPSVTGIVEGVALSPFGLQATVDEYRSRLGVDNGGVVGSQTTGRREVSWDDAPDSVATPNALPGNFFNQPFDPFARGISLSTPGSGFRLSATQAANVGTLFSNINPTYAQAFTTFSPERLMTPLGSNVTVVDFRIPGTNTPGLVRGFGAVFTDVDIANATTIEYFDINGRLLLTVSAPEIDAQKSLSFVGATFSFPVVAQVRITTGTGPLGLNDVSQNGVVDVVVMDDFIFGEPVTPASVATNTNIRGNIARGAAGNQGGGGIFNDGGQVDIFDVTISDNMADGTFGSGGGIFSRAGTVTIDEATITGNDSARAGGGIEVVGGQLTINDSLITGNETGLLPFGTPTPGNGGGVHVTDNAFVTINGGTVQNNRAALEGGGLWNSASGVMIVDGTQITGNVAQGAGVTDGGGGIFNFGGRLILDGATISNNSAVGTLGNGGGLFSQGGAVTITDTTFAGNSANRAGGGIELLNARAVLTDVTLTQNLAGGPSAAPGNGGGLHTAGASRVDIFGGLIVGNTASSQGGGLWNYSTSLMILHGGTAIRNNLASGVNLTDGGGGIFNDGGRLAIARAEFAANATNGAGGAIHSAGGIMTIENSTISGNSANTAGGGIANFGTFTSVNNTIVLNISNASGTRISAGGVFTNLGATTTLRNTLVAGNLSETQTRGIPVPSDLGGGGSWGPSAFNLIGASNSAGTLMDGVDGNIVGMGGSSFIPIAEILDTNLTDNGGPTRTHALLFSSRAVNNGNNNLARNSAGQLLQTDQRGPGFPRVFNSTVDIGAFER